MTFPLPFMRKCQWSYDSYHSPSFPRYCSANFIVKILCSSPLCFMLVIIMPPLEEIYHNKYKCTSYGKHFNSYKIKQTFAIFASNCTCRYLSPFSLRWKLHKNVYTNIHSYFIYKRQNNKQHKGSYNCSKFSIFTPSNIAQQ